MRPKGAATQPPRPGGPKPHSDPPEPKLAKDLPDTILAINPVGPIFGHELPWTNISAMVSGNHQRPPDQLSKPSPQPMGNSFHSLIPSVLKVAGVVHIWYYIPLCTIFAQKSNGDILRSHFHLSISRSQNSTPILKADYSAHQSDKVMAAIRSLFKDPNHLYLQEYGWYIIQDYSKGKFSRGITSIQSVVKASSISILLGKLNSSVQASFNQPVWP
ncbi:hypothetical protein O181_005471 [Austropuccinia psidii MF-1]|uniref:Uncharacterized protein n=1 Tax=Austropuccinia psidii MF-1 TaxID=1389203 RepID=A0A9Q3BIX2_9BASI|nr:hypothetical protein [Austropuccinia psidii MF-1]